MASQTIPKLKSVLYCDVCTLPVEYCEFEGTLKKCKEWLKSSHPDVYDKLYGEQDLSKDLENTLNVSGTKDSNAEEQPAKLTKEEKRVEREEAKRMASKVLIKTIERTKRKRVTTVQGLDAFGIETKKAAKMLANKFATGASVTKTADKKDEIVVQGDLNYDIFDFILEKFKEVPEDNIKIVEDTKSKKKQ
ncbi:translation machinery associated protein ortholog Tma22 [Schizosaccharomyces pombe]|uniref:Translation machinery-associated protein 22 n=1 Tax=Schizosaccharomyces pombe (strain 972 / ATCC 24843) TaxID=284812 RepID=DENR_SCHPO|nr:putative mitochondrial translation initiation factor [Schizosaccharomyces pombe]O42929.1 RecName: Full=Translation machinery-associated protein 22; AltName: Full=Density-regulated protein homolog [Schizosaccharomyces pombe 972h-]CAA16913.1 mitochondrial translation initiation factor (predicted) [Schizosaccharomyces pombe]|eukprot:NP_596803.1 putative mitochondrial translation initiation factor [Schizosaccharomyces pombe]